VEILSCIPRAIQPGDPVPFQFTEDGVKVRVALDDLKTAIDPGEPLIWHAGVRRIPFIFGDFATVAVDYAPDVVELVPPLCTSIILKTPPPGSRVSFQKYGQAIRGVAWI